MNEDLLNGRPCRCLEIKQIFDGCYLSIDGKKLLTLEWSYFESILKNEAGIKVGILKKEIHLYKVIYSIKLDVGTYKVVVSVYNFAVNSIIGEKKISLYLDSDLIFENKLNEKMTGKLCKDENGYRSVIFYYPWFEDIDNRILLAMFAIYFHFAKPSLWF